MTAGIWSFQEQELSAVREWGAEPMLGQPRMGAMRWQ